MHQRSYGRLRKSRSSSSASIATLVLQGKARVRPTWIVVSLLFWLVVCLLYYQIGRMKQITQLQVQPVPGGRQCVAWKETLFCSPFAERYPEGDKACGEIIPAGVSGYCLCEGNVTTARMSCGPKRFTCQQKCMELGLNPGDALQLPTPITCPYKVAYQPSNYLAGMSAAPGNWSIDAAAERAKVAPVWAALRQAVRKHDMSDARAPAVRNMTHDFVREGRRMPQSLVSRVRDAVSGFKADTPGYPQDTYEGRGIVIVGGGLKYITPAWVGVHQLRLSGCRLPIEMWFPVLEAPTEAAAAALQQIGVTVRLLDFPGLASFNPYEPKKHKGTTSPAAAAAAASDKAAAAAAAAAAAVESVSQMQQWHDHRKERQRQKKAAFLSTKAGAAAAAAAATADVDSGSGKQMLAASLQPEGSGSSLGDTAAAAAAAAVAAVAAPPPAPLGSSDSPQQAVDHEAPGAAAAAADPDPEHMARFTIKVAALVLSSFEEVLYLDADNIPVSDPSYLFEAPGYQAAGTLLWQDYWDNTVAPQVADMLDLPRERWFPGSFESGQMLLHKQRHWRGLALAMYFNSYAAFWYEMFTCFLGKGDKETFAYGMLAAGEQINVIPKPPGSIGTTGTSMTCNRRTTACRDEFTGNTMSQFDPQGRLLFLHSNMHKWDMRLPSEFDTQYQRRWGLMLPEGVEFAPFAQEHLGLDFEFQVYELIRLLKCQPWWEAYHLAQVAKGDTTAAALDGFHNRLRGIELDKLYVRGWKGNYYPILRQHKDITLWISIQHWWWYNVRPVGVRWGLMTPV